jgi:hypothetical protein
VSACLSCDNVSLDQAVAPSVETPVRTTLMMLGPGTITHMQHVQHQSNAPDIIVSTGDSDCLGGVGVGARADIVVLVVLATPAAVDPD